jgi:hypothetical protein
MIQLLKLVHLLSLSPKPRDSAFSEVLTFDTTTFGCVLNSDNKINGFF